MPIQEASADNIVSALSINEVRKHDMGLSVPFTYPGEADEKVTTSRSQAP